MATSEDGKRTVERMSGMREDCGCRDDVDALVNAVNTVDREPSDFVAGLQLQWIEIPIERPETHHRRETDQIHRAPPQIELARCTALIEAALGDLQNVEVVVYEPTAAY